MPSRSESIASQTPSAVETAPVTLSPSNSIYTNFFVTTSDGYTATVTFDYYGSVWTADPSTSKPGKTRLQGTPKGYVGVTNTTPQRQNPKYYFTKIEGLYDIDSPVCEIGPQTQFIKAAAGSSITYCAVLLAVFSANKDGTIAPEQSVEVKPFPGGVVIPSLDEALAPAIIAALENPEIVVASISVPDQAGVADKIEVTGVPHCGYRAQNSASGGWDTGGGIWVVQEQHRAVCNL